MGRGRQKAKQTKVARELKYRPVSTDFSSLERELRGPGGYVERVEEIPDQYADLAEAYSEDVEGNFDNDDEDERRA